MHHLYNEPLMLIGIISSDSSCYLKQKDKWIHIAKCWIETENHKVLIKETEVDAEEKQPKNVMEQDVYLFTL